MKRYPCAGDIVTIGNSKTEYLVTEYKRVKDIDSVRNEEYFENVLSVIRLDDAGKVNPKKYLYTIDEGSSMVRNTIVSLNDIVLVDHKKIKVVEKHEVTYIVK